MSTPPATPPPEREPFGNPFPGAIDHLNAPDVARPAHASPLPLSPPATAASGPPPSYAEATGCHSPAPRPVASTRRRPVDDVLLLDPTSVATLACPSPLGADLTRMRPPPLHAVAAPLAAPLTAAADADSEGNNPNDTAAAGSTGPASATSSAARERPVCPAALSRRLHHELARQEAADAADAAEEARARAALRATGTVATQACPSPFGAELARMRPHAPPAPAAPVFPPPAPRPRRRELLGLRRSRSAPAPTTATAAAAAAAAAAAKADDASPALAPASVPPNGLLDEFPPTHPLWHCGAKPRYLAAGYGAGEGWEGDAGGEDCTLDGRARPALARCARWAVTCLRAWTVAPTRQGWSRTEAGAWEHRLSRPQKLRCRFGRCIGAFEKGAPMW